MTGQFTRYELANIGNYAAPPAWFIHSVAPGKPTPPSASALSGPDLDRYTLFVTMLEGGVADAAMIQNKQNMGPDLLTAINAYGAYQQTPAYQSWKLADTSGRHSQWRLRMVDAAYATDSFGTIPPTSDVAGSGTAAPGAGDIGIAPNPPPPSGGRPHPSLFYS